MRQRRWLIVAVAALLLLAFAAGVYLSRRSHGKPTASQPDPAAIEKLLSTSFTDPAGRPATLAHLRGKPLIVNFWATWCPPCLQEIPVFSSLQEKHPNIQFVGIATDKADNVRNFVADHKLSYPVLVAGDGAVSLMAELGNKHNWLPFTLTIDASGQARHSNLGRLTESQAERIIAELAGS